MVKNEQNYVHVVFERPLTLNPRVEKTKSLSFDFLPDEVETPMGELWFEFADHSPLSTEPPVSDLDFLKRCCANQSSWAFGLKV